VHRPCRCGPARFGAASCTVDSGLRPNAPNRSAKPVTKPCRWSYPQAWRAACRGLKISVRWRWTRRRFRWPKRSSSSPAVTASRTGSCSTKLPLHWAPPKALRGWRWTTVSWLAIVRSARPAPGSPRGFTWLVGISGAIQHLQGIGACDKVVAINLDPGCDMIKRADLSVIGESAEILQALIAAVAAYRNDAKRDAA
jgi:hypothetical protein